ncbi:hypothetical protein TNCV_2309021 [Trichonephila clavipes]|nr:hypothetical protein TNCV_2309021 [Trichonephila clavipes]
MDRGTQIRGTRAYNPFICNLRRRVTADLALPMDAVTIDVTRVEVAPAIPLGYNSNISIFRGGCNPWVTACGPSDKCLCSLESIP